VCVNLIKSCTDNVKQLKVNFDATNKIRLSRTTYKGGRNHVYRARPLFTSPSGICRRPIPSETEPGTFHVVQRRYLCFGPYPNIPVVRETRPTRRATDGKSGPFVGVSGIETDKSFLFACTFRFIFAVRVRISRVRKLGPETRRESRAVRYDAIRV